MEKYGRGFFESDTMYEILYYLTYKDIISISKTCKSLYSTIQDDIKCWKMLCIHHIVPIQAPHHPKQWIEKILSNLTIPSYYSLYYLFKDATINPRNYYWTETPKDGKGYLDDHDHRIFPSGSLICFGDSLNFGHVIDEGYVWEHFECRTTKQLEFNSKLNKFQRDRTVEDNIINTIEFKDDKIIEVEKEINNVDSSDVERVTIRKVTVYSPIPIDATFSTLSLPLPSETPQRQALSSSSVTALQSMYPPHFSKLLELQGLCTGTYGGHGNEILHCGITRNKETLSGNNYLSHFGADELFLRGLKIQGDRNVPGWQMSWAVRIMNTVDIQHTLLSDDRPIIQSQWIMNKTERLHLIEYCFEGFGQINRVPGTWDPEWENILYIVYKRPLTAAESRNREDGTIFSVIFCPEDTAFLHIIDYRALDNRDELRKDWKLGTSSCELEAKNC